MVLLDSNVLIEHLAGRLNLAPFVQSLGIDSCFVSSVTVYEILNGAVRSQRSGEYDRVAEFLSSFPRIHFDDACAAETAKIRVELERKGMRIGPYDLMLAGTALAYDLTIVTHNLQEFERVSGLRTEDWQR